MKTFPVIIFIVLLTAAVGIIGAQEYAGQYQMQTPSGLLLLKLQNGQNGAVGGSLSGNGNTFEINGVLRNGELSGTVGDDLDGLVFGAHLSGTKLVFTMSETDDYGNAIPGASQVLVLERVSEAGQKQFPQENPAGVISINGKPLAAQEIAELENTYRVKPKPGKYWYDAKSGLYGVIGYAAFGFMLPGHQFGELMRNASAGNTGIMVNGREIPLQEYTVWSYMAGSWIQPGAYWLDQQGNAGYEGNPTPLINLYVAAQQNGYHGQGASGDNFWSSRFGAGNYDSGNARGYVSVPGYGPVGYGF